MAWKNNSNRNFLMGTLSGFRNLKPRDISFYQLPFSNYSCSNTSFKYKRKVTKLFRAASNFLSMTKGRTEASGLAKVCRSVSDAAWLQRNGTAAALTPIKSGQTPWQVSSWTYLSACFSVFKPLPNKSPTTGEVIRRSKSLRRYWRGHVESIALAGTSAGNGQVC